MKTYSRQRTENMYQPSLRYTSIEQKVIHRYKMAGILISHCLNEQHHNKTMELQIPTMLPECNTLTNWPQLLLFFKESNTSWSRTRLTRIFKKLYSNFLLLTFFFPLKFLDVFIFSFFFINRTVFSFQDFPSHSFPGIPGLYFMVGNPTLLII